MAFCRRKSEYLEYAKYDESEESVRKVLEFCLDLGLECVIANKKIISLGNRPNAVTINKDMNVFIIKLPTRVLVINQQDFEEQFEDLDDLRNGTAEVQVVKPKSTKKKK